MVLLREQRWQVSTSMVGRTLTGLKRRGVLKEPLRSGIFTRKRLWRRPYAIRKPRGYEVNAPGDLVQVDTLDVRPLPGVVSRWDVIEAHTRATATTAAGFEVECERRGLRLFVLPPRSPKLNGCVERAQRTHTEEFYEVTDFSLEMALLNQELQAWEHIYNTVRPHQALGYLTPHQFVTRWQHQWKEAKCHQSTGRVHRIDTPGHHMI